MPQSSLGTRLAEVEYHGIIAGVNSALEPLSGFGVLSLLLPFLLVDLLALVTLTSVDPFLLISPWDYAPADLLLPLGIEFLILFISFPLMAYAVNRRMEEVQHRVRVLLDDSSRRYGPRGLSFQLKQGVLNNGAATNLWVEVLVVPLVVQSPVPVPVPTVCPVLAGAVAAAAVAAGRQHERRDNAGRAGRDACANSGRRAEPRLWEPRDARRLHPLFGGPQPEPRGPPD